MDELNQLLEGMTPEELQRLIHMGTLGEERRLVDEEMQRALAFGKPSEHQHSTGLGAALGGAADLVRALRSKKMMGPLRAKERSLIDQQEQGRFSQANALVEALRRKKASAAPVDVARQAEPIDAPESLAPEPPRFGPFKDRYGSPYEEYLPPSMRWWER
jgi:hypothetical protein